jgi:hypothetical protein
MKLLEEGDLVEVKASKTGYTGPGKLITRAYGTHWLVEIPTEDERNSIITVNAMHLNKTSSAPPRDKKPKAVKYDPKDALDETESFPQALSKWRGSGRRG